MSPASLWLLLPLLAWAEPDADEARTKYCPATVPETVTTSPVVALHTSSAEITEPVARVSTGGAASTVHVTSSSPTGVARTSMASHTIPTTGGPTSSTGSSSGGS